MYGAFLSGICVATAILVIAIWTLPTVTPEVGSTAALSTREGKTPGLGRISNGAVAPQVTPADRQAAR
jgi:hypothetical protein